MMARPRYRYLMGLARSMGRPFFEVLAWPEEELVAQMAYDMTQDAGFQAAWEREQVLSLPPEERVRRDRAIWGKVKG